MLACCRNVKQPTSMLSLSHHLGDPCQGACLWGHHARFPSRGWSHLHPLLLFASRWYIFPWISSSWPGLLHELDGFLYTAGENGLHFVADCLHLLPGLVLYSSSDFFLICWCCLLWCNSLHARARAHTHTHTHTHRESLRPLVSHIVWLVQSHGIVLESRPLTSCKREHFDSSLVRFIQLKHLIIIYNKYVHRIPDTTISRLSCSDWNTLISLMLAISSYIPAYSTVPFRFVFHGCWNQEPMLLPSAIQILFRNLTLGNEAVISLCFPIQSKDNANHFLQDSQDITSIHTSPQTSWRQHCQPTSHVNTMNFGSGVWVFVFFVVCFCLVHFVGSILLLA